ncbi:hypothetical protein ACWD6N_29050 [Micromonospora sp. NPDC005163]
MLTAFEVGGELAGELGGPCRGRVGGDAEEVYPTALGLDHEGDVEALEGDRTIHVEEVRGQDGAGVGAKKRAPGVVVLSWRRYAVGT